MEFNRKKITDTKEIDVNIKIEDSQGSAEDYFARGEINMQKSNWNAAWSDFSKALEQNNKYALAYFKRGIVYHQKNQLQNALEDYNKAILYDKNIEDIYYFRGSVYLGLNDHIKAIADYTKALQIKPTDYNSLFYRAISYEKKGDYNFAIADYNKVIELNQKMDTAFFNRGKIYLLHNQPQNAQKDFNDAIAINNNLKKECDSLIATYIKKKELEVQAKKAELKRQEMLVVVNKSLQTANSLYEQKKYIPAITHYTEVIKLNQTNAEAFFKRGHCHWLLGNKDSAMQDFNQARTLDPEYRNIILGLGIVNVAGILLNKFLKK